MKAIVFNTENSVINFDTETQMIKCGYLMADKLCIAGQLGGYLLFEEEHKDFGIIRKAQFIYDLLSPESNFTEDKEVWQKSILEFLNIAKEFPRIKHPTHELVLAYNNSRRVFSDWFDNVRDNILEIQKKSGFSDLTILSNESKIETKLLNISMGRYAHSKHEAESNAKLILELLIPTKHSAEPTILMLPIEFNAMLEMIQEEDETNSLDTNKNAEKDDDDTFECLLPVLKIPDIRNLTALQLKALNSELSEPFKNLNIKLESWILFCKKNNSSIEIFDNFKANVLDNFTNMQGLIDRNQTLTNLKNNPNFNYFENNYCIGICPVDMLWIFYELYRVVDPMTLSYLKKRSENNKSYPEYLPILHIYSELIGGETEKNTNQESKDDTIKTKPQKKYLRID